MCRRLSNELSNDLIDLRCPGPTAVIPQGALGCKPCKTDVRAAINALLYLRRTECPRRYLLDDPFPMRCGVLDDVVFHNRD